MEDEKDHSDHYSDSGFWQTIKKNCKDIPFLREALEMFYCLGDPDTPSWVKVVIIAALGHFICPIDTVPDFLPIIGWIDDACVITFAFKSVKDHVTLKHKRKAREYLSDL